MYYEIQIKLSVLTFFFAILPIAVFLASAEYVVHDFRHKWFCCRYFFFLFCNYCYRYAMLSVSPIFQNNIAQIHNETKRDLNNFIVHCTILHIT